MNYEFVTVQVGNFIGARCEEHRTIINQYDEKGYRYVGFIPTDMNDYGKYREIDLIFEKKNTGNNNGY